MNRILMALVAGAALICAGAAVGAPLSADDKALEDKAGAYLQGLGSAQGRFVQTDARGQVSQGTFYLQRPGKIRFEYDPPAPLIVVADGYNVTVYDKRLNTFNAYPLNLTPLHVFLAKTIRLDQGAVVDQVTRTPTGFELTAHDGKNARAGSIRLGFAEKPMRLTEWTITDASGRRTSVQITAMKPAGPFDPKTFVISNAPAKRR